MIPVLAIADQGDMADTGMPDGAFEAMLEFQTRSDIRDMIRVHGFEEARQRIAEILMDEADRRQH